MPGVRGGVWAGKGGTWHGAGLNQETALKKDSGFRELRFQETRKSRGQAALERSGKGLREELGRMGSRKAENKAFLHTVWGTSE